jgi:hypothetical protein
MNMAGQKNDIYRVKPKSSEKNLSQCHFVRHKAHVDEFSANRRATNRLSYATAIHFT